MQTEQPSDSFFSYDVSDALLLLSEASELRTENRKRKNLEVSSGHSSADELNGSSSDEENDRDSKRTRIPSLLQMDINNLVNLSSKPVEISSYVKGCTRNQETNWMEKYNNVRKTLTLSAYPSADDVQWLNSQYEEMRKNQLSPERSELLQQTIQIISNKNNSSSLPIPAQIPLRSASAFPQAVHLSALSTKCAKNSPKSPPASPPPRSPLGSPVMSRSPSQCNSFTSCANASSKKMKRNQLSSWMCTQRQDKKSGELPEYRIKLLDLAGFVWSKQHKQKQQQVKSNDSNSEKTPQTIEFEILSTPYVLSLNGRAKRNHELWMVRYHELVSFKKRYGHLKVPTLIPDDE
eukprot:TRINITY_DN2829_c0_g1_i1.p1 TRINITY_DN2829_c0_g1~~TRINITY_DN2829_c0_g1_i1.p1  ORF type:complete len:349 (+),score=113.53 TRINITY_DN2829_c0_g1_i1:318-1364(+)